MVIELRDRIGGTICNSHLVGSISLNQIIFNQKLHDTWWKMNPTKTEYTYHKNQLYTSQNLTIVKSFILPSQYSDHDDLLTEFAL